MARSARQIDSTTASERLDRASFTHTASGFRYRVVRRGGALTLTFDHPTGTAGSKQLAYAVGSGERAFSYLLSEDGFLFEAPVAYYARSTAWGLAPGYDRYSYPFLSRPIAPACLSCHASGIADIPGTLNRYDAPAFAEGGVSCQRCHGSGERHIAKMASDAHAGGSEIVNPSSLSPAARDSICSQCHLSGDVRVMRPGADWRTYHPGDRLSDSQTVFVRTGKPAGMTITGHVENLAASACKRASGDRLWCGSCHDPHRVPTSAEAPAWFRGRCLACHADKDCSESQAARENVHDHCIGCHMPKSRATDAEHVVMTDHSIPRRPRAASLANVPSDGELVPFDGRATARDFALAYSVAALAQSGESDRARARRLLESALHDTPEDVEVLVSLAEIYRNDGRGDAARPLYARALAINPGHHAALVGMGGVAMEQGRYAEAIRLWTAALAKNVGLELVRLNLGLAQWKTGDRTGAERSLRKALEVNPAFAPARDALARIESAPRQ
jgi:hypothetical protein